MMQRPGFNVFLAKVNAEKDFTLIRSSETHMERVCERFSLKQK